MPTKYGFIDIQKFEIFLKNIFPEEKIENGYFKISRWIEKH